MVILTLAVKVVLNPNTTNYLPKCQSDNLRSFTSDLPESQEPLSTLPKKSEICGKSENIISDKIRFDKELTES